MTKDLFYETYDELARSGLCDSAGGAEYRRVRSEWDEHGRPADIATFIRVRANVGPDGPDLYPETPEWRESMN